MCSKNYLNVVSVLFFKLETLTRFRQLAYSNKYKLLSSKKEKITTLLTRIVIERKFLGPLTEGYFKHNIVQVQLVFVHKQKETFVFFLLVTISTKDF